MPTMRKTILYLLVLLPVLAAVGAPVPETAYFKTLTTDNGLPDNSVNDLEQDSLGFLWVGTWNGLARYDGKRIVNFTNDKDDPHSLGNNMVRSILAEHKGLWVGTDAGLDFFRYADGKFHHSYIADAESGTEELLRRRISRILYNGVELFALTVDGDILRLDRKRSRADRTHIVFTALPRPANRRYADLALYTGGRFMALSNNGITVFSPRGDRELRHNAAEANFDTNLNLYCDTVRQKVTVGFGIGQQSKTYHIIDRQGTLALDETAPSVPGLMATASNGDMSFYASDGDGLHVIGNDGQHTTYTPTNSSLPGDAIYTIFLDRSGNIWCGTYRQGLSMLSPTLNRFTVHNVHSGSLSYDIVTAVAPAGNKVFIGLDGGGIDIYDRTTGRSRNINSSNSGLPGNNVVSMSLDGPILWAAVYSGGLAAIDTRTGAITTHRIYTGYEPGQKLWVIKDDGMGNIWVGSRALHIFNKATKQFEVVGGCSDLDVTSFHDKGKTMLVGTRFGGILEIDKATHAIVARSSKSPAQGGIELPTSTIAYLFVDSKGITWASNGTSRFFSINPSKGNLFTAYDSHNGINDVRVSSMVEDPDGNLWIGTANGLYKYRRDLGSFTRISDGRIPSMFTANSATISGDTLFFGTTHGLLSFPATGLNEEMSAPPTIFTSIDVLDRDRSSVPIFAAGGKVELTSAQNFFTVNFSVPEADNHDQMQMEARLVGLENMWRDVSATYSSTYTNVPPGDYTLLVRHSNPDGTWNEPSQLTLTVLPPWYASTWAIVLWILLGSAIVAACAYLGYRYILNNEKARVAELERDSTRRLNEAKLDFYAKITHELRTPCFLISAQIEEMIDSERQTVPVSALNGIYRNSSKLNKLISHILDFRKIDAGALKLHARKIELAKFLADLTPDYEQLCRQKCIAFSYTHDDPPVEAEYDPDKLELIVTNLISNAYKYTPKGGAVELHLADLGDNIAISVSDTGIGIVTKMQSAIFEPFVRTERGEVTSGGDGIGLAFVKELVELHGGRIELESELNQGSKFTVILPKTLGADSSTEDDSTEPAPSVRIVASEPQQESVAVRNPTATHSILVVDDDPEVLALMTRNFDGDYNVDRASDGAEALEKLRSHSYDVVVTDLMMPGTDGHALMQAIREDRTLANIKIVVFSAMTGEDDMVRAFDEGADAYLTKPTPLKVVRRQIDRLFEDDDTNGSTRSVYNREEQKFLLECRRVIDECMLDDDFGIEMLAQRLAMSHSSLYKKIRRMTGLSLIDFINEYRISRAVTLFRQGNTNVQRVSELCGFRDIKTFRETFKRKMGMPPKQFILTLNQ